MSRRVPPLFASPTAAMWLASGVFGLTTLQVVWGWLWADRPFTRLRLGVWLLLVLLLICYSILLHVPAISHRLRRLHSSLHAHITGPRLVASGCLFLGAYGVWYAHHVWGKVLISADFGSFFYRNTLLHQIFPHLLTYNPMLNAGYIVYELLLTGSVNAFLLTYPVGILISPEVAFKAQPLLLILLLPGLIYLSGRLVEYTRAESLLAAAFALVLMPLGGLMSTLTGGRLSYVLSCELTLVVFALCYRVFVLGKSAAWGIPLIILLGSLGALHPLFALVMGPVALATVCVGKLRWKQKGLYCALIAIGLLLVNAVWLQELLSYNLREDLAGRLEARWLTPGKWFAHLQRHLLQFQVPLVLAAIVGVISLLRPHRLPATKRLGGLLLFAMGYYLFLSSTGDYWMHPALLPSRYVVPLSFFMAMAVGASWSVLDALWTKMKLEKSATSYRLNAALIALVILVCLPYGLYFVLFPTAPQTVNQLVHWLEEKQDDARVFFYGANIETAGYVSFYHAKTQQPVIGYFYGQVSGASLDWVREVGECLQNPDMAFECQHRYNIRYVITPRDDHGTWFVPLPKEEKLAGFREVKTNGNLRIFDNGQPSNYFLVGKGHVRQYVDRLAITAEPSDSVVLKFFWLPGLRTDPPLPLEPYPVANGAAFIKVQTNRQEYFQIRYR
jgi:hypothetical protein